MPRIGVVAATIIGMLVPAFASAQARVEKNVVIGMYSGLALVMDVHHPVTPNGYGIVHISGSGWRRPLAYNAPLLSESQVDQYGAPLVERGYTVFSLNHRATPRFRYPDPVTDVQRAVRFIRFHAADYGIDPERIGAIGGSSGGYLVSMLGVLDGAGEQNDPDPVNRVSAKVQTVVARAAPVDLAQMAASADEHAGPGSLWLRAAALALFVGAMDAGDEGSQEAHRYREASPVTYVSADDSPFLLLHGDLDEVVPFEQATIMGQALKTVGVAHQLIRIPGAGHGPGFPGAENPPDYTGASISWFDQHLKK